MLVTAEMYKAAVLSQDKNLMQVFINQRKDPVKYGDFHSSIAHMVFSLPCEPNEVKKLYPAYRQSSKAISFGILFGSAAAKVAESVNEALFEQHVETGAPYNPIDKAKAQEYIDIYFKRFPQLKRWIKESHNQILQHGYIYSHYGRKRRLRNINSSDRSVVGEELRSGFNSIIQGASSDTLLIGAMEADMELTQLGIDAEIVMLVHDSVVAIVKEDQIDEYSEIIDRCIQKDRGLTIPGCPIGIESDSEDGGSLDYSCGKFAIQYPELV